MSEESWDCWCGWEGKGREAAAAHWSETDHDAMLLGSGQDYSEVASYDYRRRVAELEAALRKIAEEYDWCQECAAFEVAQDALKKGGHAKD